MKVLFKLRFYLLLFLLLFIILILSENALAAPSISNISDNGSIGKYEKLEITFSLNTAASNLQFPYDPSPPPGVQPGIGISVDGQFTPDNWQTVYSIPAFYYQEFDDQIKSSREWFYPTGNYYWKVRFAPNKTGSWQYRLTAQDSTGQSQSQTFSFSVNDSANHGFIRISPNDSRYFEYDDGTYFPALGYNMNFDHINWTNPVLSNQNNFQIMSQNGIQLIRFWLSQWGIFTTAWGPWNNVDPSWHSQYIPWTNIQPGDSPAGSETTMLIENRKNPCMFFGFLKSYPAVRRGASYRVKIRYKTSGISGSADSSKPYGFVAKVGGWLWNWPEGTYCYQPGTGTIVTPYQNQNTEGTDEEWRILEGRIENIQADFLSSLYLVMENVSDVLNNDIHSGMAKIDYVWVEEDLGNNQYGPNIIYKPSLSQHLYFDQRHSYAFDKALDLARQNNIYLRPVILEKNEDILNRIDFEGNFTDIRSNNNFYGNWRNMTKVRWLQTAWWRYLQARWGYSTNIHSWELLNEGDPFNGLHWTLTDELGKYMHQFKPNDHLVSTSTWHSFPLGLWNNPIYPEIDFSDVHRYISPSDAYVRVDEVNGTVHNVKIADAVDYYDAAAITFKISQQLGAKQQYGAQKPVIRGETGWTDGGSEPPTDQLLANTNGVWLHNYIWGGINSGGLIESYWYENTHIYTSTFDFRPEYGNYYRFIKEVPLNNGHYVDAQASVSNSNLRAWGQKDLTSKRAHLWLQNKNHTWRNLADGVNISPIDSTVTLAGFNPNEEFNVQWWDTYTGAVSSTQTINSDGQGNITLSVSNLQTDTAVKLESTSIPPSPSPSPSTAPGCQSDINGDGTVNLGDIVVVLSAWGQSGGMQDLNGDGTVNLGDIVYILSNWGLAC